MKKQDAFDHRFTVMPFGKYKGQTLSEIVKLDPDYLVNNMNKGGIGKMLGDHMRKNVDEEFKNDNKYNK